MRPNLELEGRPRHYWHGFAFGERVSILPFGCIALHIQERPFFYHRGIYYQHLNNEYQAVAPAGGAAHSGTEHGDLA